MDEEEALEREVRAVGCPGHSAGDADPCGGLLVLLTKGWTQQLSIGLDSERAELVFGTELTLASGEETRILCRRCGRRWTEDQLQHVWGLPADKTLSATTAYTHIEYNVTEPRAETDARTTE